MIYLVAFVLLVAYIFTKDGNLLITSGMYVIAGAISEIENSKK